MKRIAAIVAVVLCIGAAGDAKQPASSAFPQAVRVRLWYLHPPSELRSGANPGEAQLQLCAKCKAGAFTVAVIRAVGSQIKMDGDAAGRSELRISGAYTLQPATGPPLRASFPIELRADSGHLVITALMPMEEYIAAVLAGEVGQFKSDEALKAMAVAARTYAMHFGSRHALEGFDFCDTTHCQDLRLAAVNDHLRRIVQSTAGEILWYEGEPAAAYYSANCGGTSEDGRYILGNDEPRAPFLQQHSDQYCLRNGGGQWRSEISKRELQRALAADGVLIPGTLRSVAVVQRTSSGRVELLRLNGRGSITVPGVAFRAAVGRHIGWERLKSNWYDLSNAGPQIVFHGRGSGHGVGLCQVGAEVMGEEGHSYREILAFYYPGTRLGISTQGTAWKQLANEDVELMTTRPERDRDLLPLASRYLHEWEETTGLLYRANPRLKVFASVADFRNATGEPGWVAASTRGRTIQMQPADLLRTKGMLESTLRHELLHMLVESYARSGTPLWFREGLVLYLTQPGSPAPAASRPTEGIRESFSDSAALDKALRAPASEEQLRRAYAEARNRVARMAKQGGNTALLDALQNGIVAGSGKGSAPRAAARPIP